MDSSAFEAEAEWAVPAVSGNEDADFSSIWPGLGEGTDPTTDELIQAGTEQDTALGSEQTNFFWFEAFLLEPEQEITNLIPNILDSVGIEVDCSAGDSTAFFTICDFTQQVCGQVSQVTAPPSNTAEMIVERTSPCPNGPSSGVPQELVDFHSMELTDCFYNATNTPTGVVANPIVSSGFPITMTNNGAPTGRVLARPAAVAGDPSAFTDTWGELLLLLAWVQSIWPTHGMRQWTLAQLGNRPHCSRHSW